MLGNALFLALRAIRRNLLRAFLTVLGIIIGVASVITLVTLGQGTTLAVKAQISSLGSNLVLVRPGMGFGPRAPSAGVPNFTQNDIDALAAQISGVDAIAPVASSQIPTIYRRQARRTSVVGSTPAYFPINSWKLAEGRAFDEADFRAGAAVCVIGDTVKTELFGEIDPIGESIRLGSAVCEVVGVLAAKGQVGMGNQDDTIIVPLTTMQRRLSGRTSTRDISQIALSASEDANSDVLLADITALLRERRGLGPGQDNDFNVFDTRQIAETLSASTRMMTMLLAAVAGVSLLVGGIGIMNIMLVSVTERTREIGIRMAIGALARDVMLQFLVEAVALSCIGGLVGMALALLLSAGLAAVIDVPFLIDVRIHVVAFLFSALVGVLFGFAPARRAAALDPIDALRHE